jgi:hypothetical protein
VCPPRAVICKSDCVEGLSIETVARGGNEIFRSSVYVNTLYLSRSSLQKDVFVPWTLLRICFGLIAATDIGMGGLYTAVLLGLAGFRLHRTNFQPTFFKIDSFFSF